VILAAGDPCSIDFASDNSAKNDPVTFCAPRFMSGVSCPAFHVRGDRPTPVVVAPFRFSFDNPEIVIIGFYLRKGKYLSSMTSQWRDA